MVGRSNNTTVLRFLVLPALCLLACGLFWGAPAMGQNCGDGIDFGDAAEPYNLTLFNAIRNNWGDETSGWLYKQSDLNHDHITDLADLAIYFQNNINAGGTTSWAPIAYKRHFAFDPDETLPLVTLSGADADGHIIDIEIDYTVMHGDLDAFPGAGTETGVNGDTIWNFVYDWDETNCTDTIRFRVMDDECLWSEWVECPVLIEDDADIETIIVDSVLDLTDAVSSLDAGDTVLIEGGTYNLQYGLDGVTAIGIRLEDVTGTMEKPITIRNYPGDTVVLRNVEREVNGIPQNVVNIIGCGYNADEPVSWVQIEGFKLEDGTGVGCLFQKRTMHCTLRNCEVSGNEDGGVWVMGKNDVVTNCHMHDNWPSSGTGNYDGIKVIPGSEDCWIEFNLVEGEDRDAGGIDSALPSRGHHIRFNDLRDSNLGVLVKSGAHDINIYGNKAQDCGQMGITLGGTKYVGIQFSCPNNKAYYNMALNNGFYSGGLQHPSYYNIGTINAFESVMYSNIACATDSFLQDSGAQEVCYKVSRLRQLPAALLYPLHSYAIEFTNNIGFNSSQTSGGLLEIENYSETWPPPPADAENHVSVNTGDILWLWDDGDENDENEYTMELLEDILVVSTYVADYDDDGLTDQHELLLGTDPRNDDSDGDGDDDYYEWAASTDPLDPNDPTTCTPPDFDCADISYGQTQFDLDPDAVTGDLPDYTMQVGEDYVIEFEASGMGFGDITYELHNVPLGAEFDSETGVLTWDDAWCDYLLLASPPSHFDLEVTIKWESAACEESVFFVVKPNQTSSPCAQ